MGSVIQFSRRPVRPPAEKAPADAEARESVRSLYILIGGFFATAVLMCGVVVAALSTTWMDVLFISGVVFIFALVKIVIANVLMYVMLRADQETETAAPAKAEAVFLRKHAGYLHNPPPKSGRRRMKPGAGRLAVMARNPLPRAPS
jgi:hypothetical protein